MLLTREPDSVFLRYVFKFKTKLKLTLLTLKPAVGGDMPVYEGR